jgi:hypothetical protein
MHGARGGRTNKVTALPVIRVGRASQPNGEKMVITAKLRLIDGRRDQRIPVDFITTLRSTRGRSADVLVSDISHLGFRAEVGEALMITERVGLEVPGLGLAQAFVVWREGDEYGFQFERPVDDHIVLSTFESYN